MSSKKRYFVWPLLVLAVACGNNKKDNNNDQNASTPTEQPQAKDYKLIKIYPHHEETFTEGLYLKGSKVYESAGNKKESKLLVYDLASGKILQSVDLDDQYFGEGISEINGKIYQLTYKEHKVFVYDAHSLKKIQEFSWPYEGWGMTTDGKELIVSIGSSNIYYVNPGNFQITKTISVSNNYGPLSNINELEYVDGFIYANVWQSDVIVKIDPATGKVLETIDLGRIREDNGLPKTGDVLNGIAYDSTNNSFLVTGKNWQNIFEIQLTK